MMMTKEESQLTQEQLTYMKEIENVIKDSDSMLKEFTYPLSLRFKDFKLEAKVFRVFCAHNANCFFFFF